MYFTVAIYRVCTGLGKFWKDMETENAIFQDLESFERERMFKMAMEKFWILSLEKF